VALDALLGDPRRHHPVALFGQAAAALEARDYQDDKLRGALHAAACILAVTAPAALMNRQKNNNSHAVAIALTTWAVTGARSLHREAERIMADLADDDLPAARQALPGLCGRDPTNLDATEITRAVIESVAENTSDAIVAPLIWGAVAGLPGLTAYRAINTLDAMIGHRSERYLNFGWASARLDDLANYVPARVTAALTIACAQAAHQKEAGTTEATDARTVPLPGTSAQSPPAEGHLEVGSARSALRAVVRDGSCHPSPNAGQCEAAFAGALGLRLGGTNVYDGVTEERPILGDGRAPDPGDIARAVRLSQAVTWASAALAVLIALTRGGRRSR
jgi:adenosylcobinamide-phosphate synthase